LVILSFSKRHAIEDDVLDDYLDHLRALPFVRALKIGRPHADGAVPIEVSTATGEVRLEAVGASGTISYAAADHLVRRLQALGAPGLLLASEIGREMGRHLEQRGVLFLDKQGNCNIVLGEAYVARVEGRRVALRTPRGQTSMRAAGYKVLFALLVEPELAKAPLRMIADRASASRQAASDALARLVAAGLVDRHKESHRWVPHRKRAALERWLVGYADVLRPALLIGSFRTPDATPDKLEQRIVGATATIRAWRWGGCAAGFRLTQHYRGERTVLHIDELAPEFRRAIKAVPDANGPLVILRFPGPAALLGATPDTVHPLLVYAEMLAEANERVREAAGEIAETYLAELESVR
jgi:hypothetical protein